MLLSVCGAARAGDFYAALDGKPDAGGTQRWPLDLATAIGPKSPLAPGDTLWLRGGTYAGGWFSHLEGTADDPITIRPVAGERVIVDAAGRNTSGLSIRGRFTVWRDIEITCSGTRRKSEVVGRYPETLFRPTGILVRGPGTRLVHCVVHDCGHGIQCFSEAADAEVYGCILYNNGWQGPLTGHGSGIRAQNKDGVKRLVDNVIYNQFGYGMHVYTDISHIRSFHIEGNVSFNNGSLAERDERAANFFVGSPEQPGRGILFADNHAWHDHLAATTAQLGMGMQNNDLEAYGNTLVGLTRVMGWKRLDVTDNTFVSAGTALEFHLAKQATTVEHAWDGNRYFCGPSDWSPFAFYTKSSGGGLDFNGWRNQTALDSKSTFVRKRPTGTQVVVRPSRETAGRANVILYNWDLKAELSADLDGVLKPGDRFRVVNAQDFFGRPILEGTFDGQPVDLPTAGGHAPGPIGGSPSAPPMTGPLFNVFVVLPVEPAQKNAAPPSDEGDAGRK